MARCDYCGSTILLGGKKNGAHRFCNDRCLQAGFLLDISHQIPEGVVDDYVLSVRNGRCPNCNGPGPIDVHVSHQVWSALFVSSWRSQPRVSCRACGIKSQVGDSIFSLLLGWWGFPWGLLVTPVQIGRNLDGMLRGPDATRPSAQLRKIVRMNMAASALKVAESRESQ